MRLLAGLLLILGLITSLTPAYAAEKEQRYTLYAGSYSFEVLIGTDALKTATAVPLIVRFGTDNAPALNNQNVTIAVVAEPVRGTSATPVKIKVNPASDGKSWDGNMSIPISGRWLIRVTAEGANGKSSGTASISVAPPPALPDWLAWTIGLSPAIFFLAFVILISRTAHRKRRLELTLNNMPVTG